MRSVFGVLKQTLNLFVFFTQLVIFMQMLAQACLLKLNADVQTFTLFFVDLLLV
jgi:hypothetical protein